MIHAYLRVSTAEQAHDDKTSLAEQERRTRAAALLHDCENPQIWRDEAVSGSVPLMKRSAGNEMLGKIEPGDIIIASKLDRLFRSASDAIVMAEQLKTAGVDIILLDIGMEPVMGSLCGEFFFHVLAACAQFERGRIRERITDGMRAKKAAGGRIGGTVPYGFRLVGEGRSTHLEPHPEELALIRRARVLNSAGWSQKRIADQLNQEGHRTRNDTPFQARQIGRWLERPATPEETLINPLS